MRWLAVAIPFSFVGLLSCGDARPAVIGDPPHDAGSIDAAPASHILWIDLSPLVLTPKFSPSTFDYAVRCAAGENPATLTVTDTTGTTSTSVVLVEDQLLTVGGTYFIRCLPHDFPTITVGGNGTPTPGWFLLNSSTFAMVLDTNATPVWYSRAASVVNVDSLVTNRVSFSPNATSPFGQNPASDFTVHTLDTASEHLVRAVGTPTDAHEFRRLPNGDHYLFTYYLVPHFDLTGLLTFGADETLVDCAIQHLDAQGNLLWAWAARDHVDAVQESIEPSITGTGAVDAFHCNSIDVDGTGNLLVSMRQTNAVYYVDRATGVILWKIGGATSNKDGAIPIAVASDPEGTFSTQHDARFGPGGRVTLYDDHGGGPGLARGVEYVLDLNAKTATFSWQYVGTGQAKFEGSFRRYADGESVIGWGFVPGDARALTEVDAAGHDVFDVELGGEVSYRAVKVPPSQFDAATLRATAAQ